MNSTFSDLLSLDSLPKCLTCSHQSLTLIGSPEDKTTVRGGEDGEGQSEYATEDERENVVSTIALPYPVARLYK